MSGRYEVRSGRLVVTRRAVVGGLVLAGSGGLAAGSAPPGVAGAPQRALPSGQATPVADDVSAQGAAIIELPEEAMASGDLQAVILRVKVDGE